MNVKRLALVLATNAALLAGMAVITPMGLAQDQPSAAESRGDRQPPSPDKVVERLAAKLNLTEDQKQQLLPIITERQQKMKALRSDDSMRRRAKRREAKDIMEESDKKINAILNDQQKEQYAQLKKEMREEMKERRHGR